MLKQPNLINLKARSNFNQLPDVLSNKLIRKYFLVRNPYERILSCYFDKFVTQPSLPTFSLQNCQRILLPYLNIKGKNNKEEIIERLKNISFIEFISKLKFVINKDRHYLPQYSLKLDLPLNMDGELDELVLYSLNPIVLKMEYDLNFLKKHLQLNIFINENKTNHLSFDKYFTQYLYNEINNLYEKDFIYFEYEMSH